MASLIMLQKSIEKIRWQYVTCDNISQKNLVLELKKSQSLSRIALHIYENTTLDNLL